MGVEFADLPHWEFTVIEFSPGGYTVRAIRDGGITGEGSGSDPESLLEDLKQWASGIDRELDSRESDT
jgi:hypothetical protein